MSGIYTTRQIAELLGTDEWRVRRLFEDATLSEPARFAGKRTIPSALVPAIVDALRDRGWLREPTDAPQRTCLCSHGQVEIFDATSPHSLEITRKQREVAT